MSKNKDQILAYQREYRKKNRELILAQERNYHVRNPWAKYRKWLWSRCNCVNHKSYKDYGGKGIKCEITVPELKILWFRDKAFEMETPSVDRKDTKGNYTFENCRFMELSENVKLSKVKNESS